jgi:salicylate hydroxylase
MTSFIPIENVKFSKRLTNIEQHSDKVVLSFADETSAEASIVVGGDGIQSTVRQNVLEPIHPSQVQPVYANSYCYRAVLPMAEAYEILGDLTDTAKFFFGRQQGCVTYRISGGEVSFVINLERSITPANESPTTGVQHSSLQGRPQAMGDRQRRHGKGHT